MKDPHAWVAGGGRRPFLLPPPATRDLFSPLAVWEIVGYFSVEPLLVFCSMDVSGRDVFAVFLLMRSVACNSMVKRPGRLRASGNCLGTGPAFSGMSSLISTTAGFETGAPPSSRTRI